MSPSKQISHIYNPDNQTRQELLDNFVVRLPVFAKLFRAVQNSPMDTAEQHFLIQGQRGTGKTTLLLKLAYEVENDPGLASWLIPVRLNEEQYNIFSLCRLWESVAEQLDEVPGFEDLPEVFARSFDEPDYPEQCFKILAKRLQRQGKKLLLLIDNIVDVLKKIGDKECRQLRDILHTTTEIRIIGASARTLEQSYKHDQPFFEFFKIIYLEGLTQQETETLLLKLAESYRRPQVREIIEQHPARVETLRRLTGGLPRTIILLFEIFVDDSANVFEDLELILDRITPLYKHRMDDLSGQQQAIMDAIALNWDAVTTGDIARKVRMESKAVAAQLKILEKNNLIHGIQADRKNKLYLISERFFNIWYLMRYGRKKGREQVRFLVRFLEAWCAPEELAARIKRHISLARENTLHAKGAYYMCTALAQCATSRELQHELIGSTRDFLGQACPELAASLLPSDQELVAQAFSLAREQNNLASAIRKLKEVSCQDSDILNTYGVLYWEIAKDLDQAEKYFLMAVDEGDADAMAYLALFYWQEQQDQGKAEHYYCMAVKKGHTGAMNNLANLYWQERQDLDLAVHYYRMAVDKGETLAMSNLANLFLKEECQDLDQAEKYYRMAVDKGDVVAMFNLANFYLERQDLDKAEQYYCMAVDKGDADAMYNLGVLYAQERQDLDKAEQYYRMAVDKGHTGAMNNLANFYRERQDLDKAEQYYLMAVEKGHTGAMNNLANLFREERHDLSQAEKFLRMAVEKGHGGAMFNLANLYRELQDLDKAEQYYRMAVDKGDVDATYNLAVLYEEEKHDLVAAEQYYRMAVDKGDGDAMNGLAWFYFRTHKAKAEALRLAEQAVGLAKDVHNTHTLAVCLLWNDRYAESVAAFRQFLEFGQLDRFEDDTTLYLIFLLAKKQHHLLLELFADEPSRLRERCKPVYFALMQRLQDEYPKEYKKMGEELRQTVEEVLEEAESMAQRYA